MPLRYLELPEQQYIPRHTPVNEQLLQRTAENIAQQNQHALTQRNAMDELHTNTLDSLTGLTDQQKQEAGSIINESRNRIDEYSQNISPRDSLSIVNREARQVAQKLKPFQQRSQSFSNVMQKIDESDADATTKTYARILAHSRAQNTPLITNTGELQELSTQDIVDTMANFKDYTTFTQNYVKSMSDRGVQDVVYQNLGVNGELIAQRIGQLGVSQPEALVGSMDAMLADGQVMSQLTLELQARELNPDSAIQQFLDDEGKIDTSIRKTISLNVGGENVEIPNIGVYEYLTFEKNRGSIQIAGIKNNVSTPTRAINRLGGGRTIFDTIFNEHVELVQTRKEQEGVNYKKMDEELNKEIAEISKSRTQVDLHLEAFLKTHPEYDIKDENGNSVLLANQDEYGYTILPDNITPNEELNNIVRNIRGYEQRILEIENKLSSVRDFALEETRRSLMPTHGNIELEYDEKNNLRFTNANQARKFALTENYGFVPLNINELSSELTSSEIFADQQRVTDLQQQIDSLRQQTQNRTSTGRAGRAEAFARGDSQQSSGSNRELLNLENQLRIAEQAVRESEQAKEILPDLVNELLQSHLNYKQVNVGANLRLSLVKVDGEVFVKRGELSAMRYSNFIYSSDIESRAASGLQSHFNAAKDIAAKEATERTAQEGYMFYFDKESKVFKDLDDYVKLNVDFQRGTGSFHNIDGEQVTWNNRKQKLGDSEIDFTHGAEIIGFVPYSITGEPALQVQYRMEDGSHVRFYHTSHGVNEFFNRNFPDTILQNNTIDQIAGKLASSRMVGDGSKQIEIPNKFLEEAGLLTKQGIDGSIERIPFIENVRVTHNRAARGGSGTYHSYAFEYNGQQQKISAPTLDRAFKYFVEDLLNYEGDFNEETYLDMIRPIESGGDDTIRNQAGSSALGRYQFIDDTWADLVRQDTTGTLTRDGRTNPEQQEVAIRIYNESSKNHLRNSKLPITNHNMYMLHLLGQSGGIKFLKELQSNPNELAENVLSREVIRLNQRIFEGKTVQQAFNEATKTFS